MLERFLNDTSTQRDCVLRHNYRPGAVTVPTAVPSQRGAVFGDCRPAAQPSSRLIAGVKDSKRCASMRRADSRPPDAGIRLALVVSEASFKSRHCPDDISCREEGMQSWRISNISRTRNSFNPMNDPGFRSPDFPLREGRIFEGLSLNGIITVVEISRFAQRIRLTGPRLAILLDRDPWFSQAALPPQRH